MFLSKTAWLKHTDPDPASELGSCNLTASLTTCLLLFTSPWKLSHVCFSLGSADETDWSSLCRRLSAELRGSEMCLAWPCPRELLVQVLTRPVSGLEPLIWLRFGGGWGSVSEQASSLVVSGRRYLRCKSYAAV